MTYEFRLYVAGMSSYSRTAIKNLTKICEETLSGQYEIKVIDVLEQPQLAEDEKILATPTLIKSLPHPVAKIIGDLTEKDQVLIGLDLVPQKGSTGV